MFEDFEGREQVIDVDVELDCTAVGLAEIDDLPVAIDGKASSHRIRRPVSASVEALSRFYGQPMQPCEMELGLDNPQVHMHRDVVTPIAKHVPKTVDQMWWVEARDLAMSVVDLWRDGGDSAIVDWVYEYVVERHDLTKLICGFAQCPCRVGGETERFPRGTPKSAAVFAVSSALRWVVSRDFDEGEFCRLTMAIPDMPTAQQRRLAVDRLADMLCAIPVDPAQ